ncbi:D-glycerate dehydrogenase, partial [Rhizobium ruizarguesonis]
MSKPRILVTRRWPATVETVLAARFNVTFNRDDIPLGEDELRLALSTYDAVLPTVSDRLPAAVFDG